MSNFNYYKVDFKLLTEQLGTCTEASIWLQHVLEKSKKQIAQLNRVTKRLSAVQQKFAGTEITEEKELEEIKGCIRATEQALGKKGELPNKLPELLEYANQLADDYAEAIKSGETSKVTVFMRNDKGWPMISTHMILGNFKENMKIMVNNTAKDSKIYKSKAAVSEVFSLDVKPVEYFMRPSSDIARDEDGSPKILERPIRFTDAFGNQATAISMSEFLPVGTEFGTVLRVRKGSMIEELLPILLDMGKNNGLGAWRGSGNKGAYCYKLEKLQKFKENLPAGWN